MILPSLFSVDIARLQFAAVASYHFLFVPITLGMTWMLFIMELAYVKTGNIVRRFNYEVQQGLQNSLFVN